MFRADEEPEEPETEPQPPATPSAQAVVVAPPGTPGVAFEYRTEVLTAAQLLDGTTLPEKLAQESADGWDLVDLVQAQDKHVLVLRKPKKPDRGERRVGFFSR
ncbi:MAG: hypothetical protein J2P43_05250 [Candidatus Dormibacteraeota bacterium]|nr:hypothetical protein [Candidatus Dormibacteraeota bacterium]